MFFYGLASTMLGYTCMEVGPSCDCEGIVKVMTLKMTKEVVVHDITMDEDALECDPYIYTIIVIMNE